MLRGLLFATLLLVSLGAAPGQDLTVLHIKVAVVDAEGKPTPAPRHALLISDNPPSAPPRRIVTGLDGSIDVKLRPGNYTVESDQPVIFHGKAYQWTQEVDIVAGRDAVLELTAANADVELATSAAAAAKPGETDPSFLLPQWQDSVVALWTPTARGSGFLIDTNGLIATNQRLIGAATSVEVQLSPDVKVAGNILAADPARDVAILWIDPKLAASLRPVPLGCAQAEKPPIMSGQDLFAIGAPIGEQKGMIQGTVSRVEPSVIATDFRLASGGAGGPVFTADGGVVGITSIVENQKDSRREISRVVRIDAACDVVATAVKKMTNATPPDGTHLPVEPTRPFPVNALKDAVQGRAGSLSPYKLSSSDFDIAFITPVLIYGADQLDQQRRISNADPRAVNLMDFGNWSEYMADFPPVLLIRVTPKLVESLWTTVARGAAMTQGMPLPAFKHIKSGFSRMRLFCGDAEVTPIHPFKLEQHISETNSVYEGLYVVDPGALGPHCEQAKLVLYSEKEPGKGDTLPVDPKVLRAIWQDFAPYREP